VLLMTRYSAAVSIAIHFGRFAVSVVFLLGGLKQHVAQSVFA
jgi:hypothetical protein